MERFSVRKPYTVLVCVLIVLVLGFVSATSMSTDLLPELSLPYLVVITTYPGASPERVEASVSEPMESSLGTVTNVKNVYSISAENYSVTELEFEDGTDMDSATVRVSSAVEQVAATLPDGCGTPSIMEVSMDMVATMYVAVSRQGDDIYELSQHVEDDVIPAIERVDGVASVSGVGLVEQSIQVDLNQDKIDRLNDRILAKTTEGLDEAGEKLDAARAQVEEGQAQLDAQEKSFGQQVASGIESQLNASAGGASAELESAAGALVASLDDLDARLEKAESVLNGEGGSIFAENGLKDAAEEAAAALTPDVTLDSSIYWDNKPVLDTAELELQAAYQEAQADLNTAMTAYENARASLEAAQNAVQTAQGQIDESKKKALEDAESTYTDAANALNQAQLNFQSIKNAVETAGGRIAEGTVQAAGDRVQGYRAAYDTIKAADLKSRWNSTVSGIKDAYRVLDGGSVKNAASAINRLASLIPVLRSQLQEIAANLDSYLPAQEDIDAALLSAGDDLNSEGASLAGTLSQIREVLVSVQEGIDQVTGGADSIPQLLDSAGSAIASLSQGQLDAAVGFSSGIAQLEEASSQLEQAQQQYDTIRQQALSQANLDSLLSVSTLSTLIYAQNFSMPAGYIDDQDDNSWLLKVGDEYSSPEEIEDALLADVDGIGTIRLSDVADITVIDNANESYTSLNGEDAIALAVYKGSTAGTNNVSRAVHAALDEITENDPAYSFIDLMDQGSYITLIVNDLLMSMASGALLAIIVLAMFLRDVRPTLIVGISIPLSVLFTLVLMYFSGLTLNIMTLSGLSLGVGMLVDNSIVVMENILRLRTRGVEPARAAVQGAKQVSGSVIASTLTTICVFMPMVFTEGTVRTLMVPMALSITYCLTASLIVSMTVIPASASTILRKTRVKESKTFNRVLEKYRKALFWCLSHKAAALIVPGALMALCIWRLASMGIVLIPQMDTNTVTMTTEVDDQDDTDAMYAKVDEVMQAVLAVDGVENVGIMDQASGTGLVSSLAGGAASSQSQGVFIGYVTAPDDMSISEIAQMTEKIREAVNQVPGQSTTVNNSGMSDMTALLASGLSVNVYGDDMEELQDTASRVAALIEETEGFENVSDGSEDSQKALHLVIDKDKAMAAGVTVAQIYQQIAQELTVEVTSTQVSINGAEMDVIVRNDNSSLTRENLLDMEFTSDTSPGAADGAALLDSGSLSALAEDDAEEEDQEDNGGTHKLSEFASLEETDSPSAVNRENQVRYITVTADTKDGYNTTVASREVETKLAQLNAELPSGYTAEISGETTQVREMLDQMLKMILLALIFVYLVMVAQFQSFLSPFIIMFTIPLAFTGGMLGLIIADMQLSMLSLMGFLVLLGTVVNNGIVFVDYTNQLRIGGLERKEALAAAGMTRMRPILMSSLTTILAMAQMIFGDGMGSQMGRGMAIVIAGGLLYSTFMTLFVVPVMYDIFYKKQPLNVVIGEDIDDAPDDAADYIRRRKELEEKEKAKGEEQ